MNTTNNEAIRDRPWYQQVWPWILIAIPTIGMILSMITVSVAISGADGDVRDGVHVPLDKTSWKHEERAQ